MKVFVATILVMFAIGIASAQTTTTSASTRGAVVTEKIVIQVISHTANELSLVVSDNGREKVFFFSAESNAEQRVDTMTVGVDGFTAQYKLGAPGTKHQFEIGQQLLTEARDPKFRLGLVLRFKIIEAFLD